MAGDPISRNPDVMMLKGGVTYRMRKLYQLRVKCQDKPQLKVAHFPPLKAQSAAAQSLIFNN